MYCFYSHSNMSASEKKKGNCCGWTLIAPSVLRPTGRSLLLILSHIQAGTDNFHTERQLPQCTPLNQRVHHKEQPVIRLAVTACTIRRPPPQMRHGAARRSRLLHLPKGCFHHWRVIWNLFLDTFPPFRTN